MKEIYELDVYKLSEQLSDLIWYGFEIWPKKVQQTIGYQIIWASDNICANLAEGYSRYTPADRKLFLSLCERIFQGNQSMASEADPP